MARAKTSPCPAKISPQLVTLANSPPAGGDWLYEIKFDGFRMLVRIDQGVVTIFTRNGFDWTKRMPRLVQELQALAVSSAWIDGEVIIQDDQGRPVFQPLQSAFSSGRTDELVYFAWDCMYLNGEDLRAKPLEQRRELLCKLLEPAGFERVRFSETLAVDPRDLMANICAFGMEGVVGKRAGSAYTSERSGAWIKIKCGHRQEFVIVGYTRAAGGLGSLLIGLHDDTGALTYAGRVKSGFSARTLADLRPRLRSLERSTSALRDHPKLNKGIEVVWLEPELVCEVRFCTCELQARIRDQP